MVPSPTWPSAAGRCAALRPAIARLPDLNRRACRTLPPWKPSARQVNSFTVSGGNAPQGWHIDAESTTHCLLWDGPIPANDPAPDAEKLGGEHATAALELVRQAGAGPFGLRSIELGDYFGYFDNGRLVAMAGERFAADGLR
jgi:hypothetical protein